MGVESKGSGRGRPQARNQRGRPPRTEDISVFIFFTRIKILHFSDIFAIKWPKSEEKLSFGLGMVGLRARESVPPNHKFVAPPLSVVADATRRSVSPAVPVGSLSRSLCRRRYFFRRETGCDHQQSL